MTKNDPYDKIFSGDDMEIKIKYSKRKTLAVEVTRDAIVLVRAPIGTDKKRIDDFVMKHTDWIDKQLAKRKEQLKRNSELSKEAIEELKKQAWAIIPNKVKIYSEMMGVHPNHISINSAKTRFGSCSSTRRLNFSCRLMLYPEEAIDYVIVHELAHLKVFDHSKRFWAVVEKYVPDYMERREMLKK